MSAEESVFVASGVVPTVLLAMEPPAAPLRLRACLPADNGTRAHESRSSVMQQDFLGVIDPHPGASDAAKRLLRSCSSIFSAWFAVARDCIWRDRVRQQLFREGNGLSREFRVPYEPQPLTAAEESVVKISFDMVRSLFGETPAAYAMSKFRDAIRTGDKRAFKIRILILKARDSLRDTVLYGEFVKGVDECISEAERLAGCKPDPTPRRLSRAEQEKKLKREKALDIKQRPHCRNGNKDNSDGTYPELWDSELSVDIAPCYGDGTQTYQQSYKHDANLKAKSNGDVEVVECDSTNVENRSNRNVNKNADKSILSNNKNKRISEAISTDVSSSKRTARKYSTVSQILEDIDAGNIKRYETVEEICKDVKSGIISEAEAMMFTVALDRYSPMTRDDMDDDYNIDMDPDYPDDVEGSYADDSHDDTVRDRWEDFGYYND